MVWCNYEYAWGGTYQIYYKEQTLNNINIDKDHLQLIKFQGQFFDTETSLHYNRFRYYDTDVGMFIQRDPIGLLGGNNVFAYAPNPISWIDPFGLANRPNNGKYKIFTEYTIPKHNRYSSDAVQFRQANISLKNQLDTNPIFAKKMYKKYPQLENWVDMGKRPPWSYLASS